MEEILYFTVDEDGLRADRFLCEKMPDFTRSAIVKLMENGEVTCGTQPVAKGGRLTRGQQLCVHIPQPQTLDVLPEAIPLDIRYEDDDLLVVNKPKDMVVHPAAGHYTGTLVNALLYHCKDSLSGINGVIRPGIVHRIDKDTSGLLIVAKNDFAHVRLAQQIKEHSFLREYQAVVYGNVRQQEGSIALPIGRSPKDRQKMAVIPDGKNARDAVTHYFVMQRYEGFTHVRLRLETGRTHQIRVHMSYIGHPVAGDAVYGPSKVLTQLGGQCLHAGLIGFVHPRDGRWIQVESELPAYFTQFLQKLRPLA